MLTATALFAVLVLAWGSPVADVLAAALGWVRKLTSAGGVDVPGAATSNARSAARRV